MCLCGRDPHWAEYCLQWQTLGSFEVLADIPFWAETKLVLFCITKTRGDRGLYSQLKSEQKGSNFQELPGPLRNLLGPSGQCTENPWSPRGMQCVPGEASLSPCPHSLHSFSQAPTRAFRAVYANMYHVRVSEINVHKTQLLPQSSVCCRRKRALLTYRQECCYSRTSTKSSEYMGPRLEVWRGHLSMKKVKNSFGRESTGLQKNT